MFGLRADNGNLFTSVPLDRLANWPKTIGNYNEERPENYMDYFKERVGVSMDKKEKKKKHLVIRITDKEAWGRITTKPLNESQNNEIKPFDQELGYGQISLDLVPNMEFYLKILSLGEGVEVETPAYIRARLAELLKRISRKYQVEKD